MSKMVVPVLLVVLVIFLVGGWALTHTARIADKVAEDSLVNYEEFQEIYNTCQRINSDLATIRKIDEGDAMFTQFSKQAQIAQKRQQLSRWVNEYNAKSRMWNRAIWKSNSLPYQLDLGDFDHYEK